MSNLITKWAWEAPATKLFDRSLLVLLSDHASDDGICWPGQERLAKRMLSSVDTVQRAIKRLIRDGKIAIAGRGKAAGGRATNVYLVLCPHREQLHTKHRKMRCLTDATDETELHPQRRSHVRCSQHRNHVRHEPSLREPPAVSVGLRSAALTLPPQNLTPVALYPSLPEQVAARETVAPPPENRATVASDVRRPTQKGRAGQGTRRQGLNFDLEVQALEASWQTEAAP